MSEPSPAPPAGAPRDPLDDELKAPPEQAKKLLLDPSAPLAEGMAQALGRILGYAVASAQRVETHPKKAVHEFRKSIRRSRALVKLSRPFLPKELRKDLDAKLRAAVTPTSLLRDLDVLLEHVKGLEHAGDGIRERLKARLESEREARDLPPATEVLETSVEEVAQVDEVFAGALPKGLTRKKLRKALQGSYKAARGALAEAAGGTGDRDEAIHRFRKRVKELRYSLELLRGVVPGDDALAFQAELAEELGSVTDLLVLRAYVQECEKALGADALPLLAALGADIERERSDVLSRAARVFAAKPKAFAAGLLPKRKTQAP